MNWQITNATLLTDTETRKVSGCTISGGRIDTLLEPGESDPDLINLNLHGMLLMPGLINAHDTLIATYDAFPGPHRPYRNWLAWDNDLKSSPVFKERMLVDLSLLYSLGAYRNLLGGTTSVVDHIPHFVRSPFQEHLIVSLLKEFGIAHSVCSYSLDWGDGLRKEIQKARENDLPFITHIAEGFDPESRQSLSLLDELGGLDGHSVLVHGLGLSEEDLDRIAETGAHFVWCPSSNMRIYSKTAPIQRILDRGIPVSLGTDSAMTGSINLLHEMGEADRIFRETTGGNLSPEVLFKMVTTHPARAFRWEDRGTIDEGQRADLLVLDLSRSGNPLEHLSKTRPADIFLVVRDGIPVYGDPSLDVIFQEAGVEFEAICVDGSNKIIQIGIKKLLDSITKSVGYFKNFPFLPLATD